MTSESTIHNYHYPNDVYRYWFKVNVDPSMDPDRVKKNLVKGIISTECVLKDLAPIVRFTGLTKWSAEYIVSYSSKNYADKVICMEAVWKNIWNQLKIAGISPVFQRQDSPDFLHEKFKGIDSNDPVKFLENVEIFSSMSNSLKSWMGQKMYKQAYKNNSEIVVQNTEGDSLYFIIDGVVSINITITKYKKEQTMEVCRLGACEFFGEISLLNNSLRSASVTAITDTLVYKVDKKNFLELIEKSSDLEIKLREKVYNEPRFEIPKLIIPEEKKENVRIYKRLVSNIYNLWQKLPGL